MRRKQKVVWANPQAARSAADRVPNTHLGHFAQPAARPVGHPEPEVGSMWFTTCGSWLITGAWDGTELSDNPELEGDDIAYLSPSKFRPSPRGDSSPVPAGTVAIYMGGRRVTEWDGKGWARPVRSTYLVNGVVVAAVSDIFRPA